MDLLQLRKATARVQPNHSILVYGGPKMGKTELVGTAAKVEELDTIWWIDLENGVETLLGMGLTDEQLQKVKLIRIADTRDNPIAIETLLKAFTSKTPLSICELHGKIDCADCLKTKGPFIKWHLGQCTHNDLVVVDSGSQLGDSALAAACLGKPAMFKPTFDEYGMVSKWLGDICSVIQQCANTNFVVITHEIALEDDEGKDKIFPLFGSKAFSMKAAKFFGTVVYVHKKLNKHTAGSSSTYQSNILTGSRLRVALEKNKEPSMRNILIDGGILRAPSEEVVTEEAEVKEQPKAPMTLAERIAAQKAAG